MCIMHTMEYYSAMKRSEILIRATWMYLKDTRQSEIRQTQMDK